MLSSYFYSIITLSTRHTCLYLTLIITVTNLHWFIGVPMSKPIEDKDEDIPEVEVPKKVIHKFRYGTKAPKDEYEYDFKFDFEAVEFDPRALRDKKPEPHKTFKFPEEHTFFLIKPGAMVYKDQIVKRIYDEGFLTLKEKTVWLTSEQISEFYIEHYGKPWFPKFILNMTAGPIHIMIIAKDNAIDDLKALMGHKRVSIARREAPYSLRALYGLKGDSGTNAVHGSENRDAAIREIHFFYPQVLTEPLPQVDDCIDYLQENVSDILYKGLMTVSRTRPANPLRWLAEWFLLNNSDSPLMYPEYIMYNL